MEQAGRVMIPDPKRLKTTKDVRAMMKNAADRGEAVLVDACKRRLFELSGVDIDDPVDRRLAEAVAALEETYREKHGRAQPAGYTRRKIAKDGAVATLSGWALKKDVTPGFVSLVEAGMAEFTGEYVIAEFPDRFEPHVVAAARKRLSDHGVELP